ncbi:hypothetical protein DXG03_004596 [Asterophora parasitica]|uniref:Association with the SNF1 complex (ASC) domain-containing protein n=1 Tax=Asterophora parasitica TaxID=117018 RepID=A0A9P7GAJ4_9AGAR|nr:hypothetical protein DXG03_004596 [Asterophora parasitica]
MGNASSQASGPRRGPVSGRTRQSSSSPSPGNPHSSLRTKKKSLELPDLASLTLSSTRGRQHSIPPKSASIPIPAAPYAASSLPGEAGRTRAPITLPSNADVQLLAGHQPSTHQPFPPPARSRQSRSEQRRQQQRIQELYNQSQQPQTPKQQVFVAETVHSTIPIALTQAIHDVVQELVPVTIAWRGGGKSVFLARAGDDDWKGRLAMTPESPTSSVYYATVSLPPGTHHIRFLIDDLWRVADDLPTAVDDQGSLANYVAVPITYSPPAPTNVPASPPTTTKPPTKHGQSFWSAASSTDDEDQKHHSHSHSHSHNHTHNYHTHNTHNHTHHHHHTPQWTSVLPPELIEAAREEEAYLAASEPTSTTGHRVQQGFVPAPNIPPAPNLPRHLEKLILNSRAVTGGAGGAIIGAVPSSNGSAVPGGRRAAASNSVGGRSKGRERDRDRDRDRRDRDRDGERRRPAEKDRRGNPPPPPPPSEAGTEEAVQVEVTVSPAEEEETQQQTQSPNDVVSDGAAEITSTPASPTTSTLAPSPTPASPGPASETSTPVPAHYVPSFLPTTPPPVDSITPIPTSPSTPVPPSSTPTIPSSSSTPTPIPTHLAPPQPTSRPLTLGLEANTPALTDDGSVLPVPSHVVLHHLSTSAIRNGVLAVGNTTRFRKKYLTTIYYKPT